MKLFSGFVTFFLPFHAFLCHACMREARRNAKGGAQAGSCLAVGDEAVLPLPGLAFSTCGRQTAATSVTVAAILMFKFEVVFCK